MRNDSQFDSLSADQQQLIRDRLEELETYLQYFDRLRQSPRPQDVHTENGLRELKEQLKTELAPRESWKDTEAGRLHGGCLQDAESLDVAVKRAEAWYRDSTEKAENLRTFSGQQTGRGAAGVNWDRWTVDAATLIRPDYRPHFTGSSPVPGVP